MNVTMVSRYAAGCPSRCCVIKSNRGTLLRGRRKLLSLRQRSEPLFVGCLLFQHRLSLYRLTGWACEPIFFSFSLLFCPRVHNSVLVLKAHRGRQRTADCQSHAALLVFAEQSGGLGQPESQTAGKDTWGRRKTINKSFQILFFSKGNVYYYYF